MEGMLKRVKEYWTELKRGVPGSRFEEQHDDHRRGAQGKVGRTLRVIAGVILIPAGMFFLAVPGPGLLIMGLGAILLAREFRFAAKLLDRLELRVRPLVKRLQRLWRKLKAGRRAVTR